MLRRVSTAPAPFAGLYITWRDVLFSQVYNENIRDLLNDTGDFLDLREDPIKARSWRHVGLASLPDVGCTKHRRLYDTYVFVVSCVSIVYLKATTTILFLLPLKNGRVGF